MNRTFPNNSYEVDPSSVSHMPSENYENISHSIQPPLSYRAGLLLFYGSFGLTFTNMTVLEDASSYRGMIAILSGFGFLLAFGARGLSFVDMKHYRLTSLMLKVWLAYTVFLTIVTLTRQGEVTRTIYTGTVFYYMLMSMTLSYRHIQAGYDNKYFWQNTVLMAILATSVNFYFARFSSAKFNESEFSFIEDVRSQIISGSSMIITGVALIGIIKRRNLFFSYVLFFAVMFIFIISKTRSILLGVSLVVIYAVLVSSTRGKAAMRFFIGLIVALILAYLLPLYTINFDIYDAWFGRVFTETDSFSVDTFYTRLAEYQGQFQMLTEDIQSGLFGFGYLQTMIWDSRAWDILFPELDPTLYYDTRAVGQHSTWINSLFQGGFIMGLIPTISAFGVTWIAIRQILLPKEERAQLDIYGLFGTAIVVYMLIPSTFGMLYVDRLSTVSFAPALIYAVYGWEKYKNTRKGIDAPYSDSSDFSPPADLYTGQLASEHVIRRPI